MKPHVKIYLDNYGYGVTDIILCENCGKKAVDIHHIQFRSQGGKDEITNLIALCRECHCKAHTNRHFNDELKIKKLKEIRGDDFLD